MSIIDDEPLTTFPIANTEALNNNQGLAIGFFISGIDKRADAC